VALRTNLVRLGAALAFAVPIATFSTGCGGDDRAAPTPATTTETTPAAAAGASPVPLARAVARVRKQLAGIPQAGFRLGKPAAPIAIIEYGGFDCEACASVHVNVLPAVIERYVRPGRASIEFRALAAGGHDLALTLAAQGARPQRRGWHLIQLQYLRFGIDPRVPLAAIETPSAYATALGLDVPRWKRDIERRPWATDLKAALTVFKLAKWGATPVFLIRRVDRDVPFEVLSVPTTLAEFDTAISAALAR
jgi:hypothetical protein